MVQYEFVTFLIAFGIMILVALVFLFIGYFMGRQKTYAYPLIQQPKQTTGHEPPYHDNAPSIYDEALMDDEGGIETT